MYSEPPLTEQLRQIDSPRFSALPETNRLAILDEIERIKPALSIELAIKRASAKQLAFMHAFFNRQDDTGRSCDVFAALGANRSGKSWSCGWLCFAQYLRDYARDGDWYWCVAQTLERSIGGQQQELWRALPRTYFASQQWEEKGGFGSGDHAKVTLELPTGGRCLIEFRSADQALSTFEQAKLDGVWIDERCSEAIYGRLIPRVIDKNGFILYSDIPEQFWQLERLQEAPPAAGIYFQAFEMQDNAHNLPDGAIDKAAARMSQDEIEQKIKGHFLLMEGIVFKQYIDHIHAIDDFVIPPDWPRWRMIDYGGSSPTACPWVAMGPNEHIFVYREHYDSGRSVGHNASRIIEASQDEKYAMTFIDPAAYSMQPGMPIQSGIVQTIAMQYFSAGIDPLMPWPRVNEMGEHAMVQKVKYRFESHTLWIFKSCTNMRRELRSWKHQLDKEGRPKSADAYENANNHLIDGLKGFIATNPTFHPTIATVSRRT